MRKSMAAEQVISASARIEFRQKLSEVQICQLISQLSVAALPDPIKAFQLLLFMSNRRQPKSSNRGAAFWLDPKVQKWNKCKESSLVIISGTWKTRFYLQDCCAKSIVTLRDAKCPAIWALKSLNVDHVAGQVHVSTIDLLKYIISQAISINKDIHTDAALIPCLTAHLRAESEEEWIGILASVLQGIPFLYIMIDVEVLSKTLGTLTNDFWPAAFIKMISKLSARNIGTIL
ncbi:nacht domain [Trichoderma arundinaceum]|uniref:Nacht domain n=1 Tax=Trichoderma arundinaceum TaxID=490622 RepID=A0A395N763_TRIAR|nr:nacht domain [Trichoderma arundinaceum]